MRIYLLLCSAASIALKLTGDEEVPDLSKIETSSKIQDEVISLTPTTAPVVENPPPEIRFDPENYPDSEFRAGNITTTNTSLADPVPLVQPKSISKLSDGKDSEPSAEERDAANANSVITDIVGTPEKKEEEN